MPRHGIKGVTQAHPFQFQYAGPNRGNDIQENWEHFLRRNPSHRPGRGPRTTDIPCIIHNISAHEPRRTCASPCVAWKLREKLRSYLDHEEPWHCVQDNIAYPVLFGHPYSMPQGGCDHELQEFLQELPDNSGRTIAIYQSDYRESWYVTEVTAVFIQNRSLPTIPGWLETTVDGTRWVPDPNANTDPGDEHPDRETEKA